MLFCCRLRPATPILASVFISLMYSACAQAAATYRIEALPATAGYINPWAINNHGHVYGANASSYGNQADASVWKWDGNQITHFPMPADRNILLWNANDQGIAVGQSSPSTGGFADAIVIDRDGTLINLGKFGGLGGGITGINQSGELVGISITESTAAPPFETKYAALRGDVSGLTPMPIGDAEHGWVGDINDDGVVVGVLFHEDGQSQLAMWNSTNELIALGSMGDYGPTWGLNQYGVAIGGKYETIGGELAYVPLFWDGEQETPMGRPLGSVMIRAWALNDDGIAVGHAGPHSNDLAAILWESDGAFHHLMGLVENPEGWSALHDARDINDAGQIIGTGVYNGERRAFILTAIPEPTAAALMVLGGALLIHRLRGRQ